MWPLLLLLPLFGFVGASVIKKGATPAKIPDSRGQAQAFSVNAPADGSAAPADYLLNKPFASPNGVAPTLPEWYDIMRGAPDDFGFNDMFVGPASTPGGKLNSILPPNYVKPNTPAPQAPNAPVYQAPTPTPTYQAPVVTSPASNISVAPAPAPAPTPVRTVTPQWSINGGINLASLGNIPGVNAPIFS